MSPRKPYSKPTLTKLTTRKPNADQLALLAAKQMSTGRESTGRIVAAVIRNKAQVLMSALDGMRFDSTHNNEAYQDGCETVGVLVAIADALEGR